MTISFPPRLFVCTPNGVTAFLPISSASPVVSRTQHGIRRVALGRS
jgi:hypothetical protein